MRKSTSSMQQRMFLNILYITIKIRIGKHITARDAGALADRIALS